MAPSVANALRMLRNLRKVKSGTIEPVAPAASDSSHQWESLVPSHSHSQEMQGERLDPDQCQRQVEGGSSMCLPSVPLHSSSETRNSPTMADDSQQGRNNLNGIWEVTQHCAAKVCGEIQFMIIQGDHITTAHMKTYVVNRANSPNSLAFGDAVGELSTDGTLKLTLANGNVAVYRHFDPPSEAKLGDVQGFWVLWHKGKYVRDFTLRIEGACVEILNKGEVSKHYLHVPKQDGSVRLGGFIMDNTMHGSVFLRTKSGQLMQYVHVSVHPSLASIEE